MATFELVPELLVTVLSLLWLTWIGRLIRIATGRLWRDGGASDSAGDLTRADIQFLHPLHIRP